MKARLLLLTFGLMILAGCAQEKREGADFLKWREVGYGDLPGWQRDNPVGALDAFIRSCDAPKASQHAMIAMIDNRAWRTACAHAPSVLRDKPGLIREFFETHFTPYQLYTDSRDKGLLTGYYLPVLNGSRVRTERYNVPVYAPPTDVKTRRPNYSRKQIVEGALNNKGLELIWVDDEVMLFFMHIQGSGRVQLADGTMLGLQYANTNGHGYTPIGRNLVEMGELTLENVSLQSIRQWLYDHPAHADDVMNINESYVFFSLNNAQQMAKGAQGVPLTPERSLAIDPSQVPYGLPVYIDTRAADGWRGEQKFRHLLITQDTGGAIKGPMRGDIFFGEGLEAEARAGVQKEDGRWYILIPSMPDGSH